jgi:glutathione peroxidase
MSESSIYDFSVKDLHDNETKLSKFDNNQVLLIVNFTTNDELADRNFLELKELKSKYCDGEK